MLLVLRRLPELREDSEPDGSLGQLGYDRGLGPRNGRVAEKQEEQDRSVFIQCGFRRMNGKPFIPTCLYLQA